MVNILPALHKMLALSFIIIIGYIFAIISPLFYTMSHSKWNIFGFGANVRINSATERVILGSGTFLRLNNSLILP